MKNLQAASLAVAIAAALSACGGGSSDSSNDGSNQTTTTSTTYTLSGTVPGTLIEGFCDDGSYASTNSIQDGTNQHPFTLTLPLEVNCRLVMTTNENDAANKVITPISLRSTAGSSIAFSNGNNSLDLGYIDLAMTRTEMLSDLNGDGVEDLPLQVSLSSTQENTIVLRLSGVDPLDEDGDGVIDVYEDTDGDQIPNRDDDDDDNDGIPDIDDLDADGDGREDNDHDGDGIENGDDIDDDNDGINDSVDRDDDNDGKLDEDDDDDDNDGVSDDSDEDTTQDTSGTNTGSTPASEPSAGRLLAAQCSQCHGTDGHSLNDIDSLAGEGKGEIIEEMREMHADNDVDIMVFQAKGYNDEQIQLLAEYLDTIPGGSNDDD